LALAGQIFFFFFGDRCDGHFAGVAGLCGRQLVFNLMLAGQMLELKMSEGIKIRIIPVPKF
jgi:hypothetical protein